MSVLKLKGFEGIHIDPTMGEVWGEKISRNAGQSRIELLMRKDVTR